MTQTEERKNVILSPFEVKHKIRRIAFEIYENNFEEPQIVLAGIEGQGYLLAQLLEKELSAIAPMEVKMIKVSLTKPASHSGAVAIDCEEKLLNKKCIVLVDDVLNTGKTLAFGVKPFLSIDVKKIEVAVLINRSHALFPVHPTYAGLELSTTLDERVEVVLNKKSFVYLY